MGINVSFPGANEDNSHLSVLERFAKQSSTIATLHSKEEEFDDVLESEIRAQEQKPKTKFQKFRCKGKHLLHSKPVLVIVVALCVIDCVLVISELILDMHAIKESTIGDHGDSHGLHNDSAVMVSIVNHHNEITTHTSSIHRRAADSHAGSSETSYGPPYFHGANSSIDGGAHVGGDHGGGHHEHSIQQKVAHALHFASITILAILVFYTLMKILFQGREFITKKIEVFDAIVVIASFVIDLVFLEGITTLPIRESAYILSFILPWRVIRVVNSLVVAVLDHEHFKLMLVYKSKKYLKTQMDEMKDDLHLMRKQLHAVKALCVEAGAQEWMVNQSLMKIANQLQKKKKQALSSFASLTAGAIVDEKKSFRISMRKRSSIQATSLRSHDSSVDDEESKTLLTSRPSNGSLKNSAVIDGGENIQHPSETAPSGDSPKENANTSANTQVDLRVPEEKETKPRQISVHFDVEEDIDFADDD